MAARPDLTLKQVYKNMEFDELMKAEFLHGEASTWKYVSEKLGSRVPATSAGARPGAVKVYEVWRNAKGIMSPTPRGLRNAAQAIDRQRTMAARVANLEPKPTIWTFRLKSWMKKST